MAKNRPNTPSSTLPGGNAGDAAGGSDGAGCVPNPDSPAGAAAEGCAEEEEEPCCTITSQTVQTQPADRARTRIGVGEVVNLTVDPAPGTWSVDTGGTLSSTSGATVQFTAGDVAATATITAAAGGCNCTLELEVVAPTGVSIRRDDARGFFHRRGKPSAGFVGVVHISPADVNFDAIEYHEDDVDAVGTDRLDFMDGESHHPTPGWLPVSERVIAGRGSESGIDQVQVLMNITGSLDPGGTVTWSIPWHYRVNGGTSHTLATIDQVVDMDNTGSVTISKGGASVTKARNDANSSMDTTPPIVEDAE